jgi:hypothetical protein
MMLKHDKYLQYVFLAADFSQESGLSAPVPSPVLSVQGG